MRSNRSRRSLAIAAVLVALCGSAVAAQPATPAPYPSAPDPAGCVVPPRPAAEVVVLVATPVSSRAVGPATPFAVPEGTPADDATAREVAATLHQVFACANAGDPLRFASLYTDEFLRGFFGGVPASDLEAFLAQPPQPLPAEQQRIIREIGEVTALPDGRAGVVVVLDEPDDPRTEEPDYVILERVNGRWLVDEVHEDGGMTEATPIS